MSVTREQVQAAFDAAYASNEASLNELTRLTEQLKAIDAASPDAQATWDKLYAEYKIVKDRYTGSDSSLREKYFDLDQAWRDSHNGYSFSVISWNALNAKLSQASADRKAISAIKKTEIENAASAKANGGSPGVTANLAPTVNIAPDPAATKNPIKGSANDDQSKKAVPGLNQKPTGTGSSGPTGDKTVDNLINDYSAPDAGSNKEKPGKRLQNPLADFPTYTYNLSLYMITPEGYDEFLNSGRKTINASPGGGAYIIAQSGGINSTNEQRAAGFSLDYYIDNLSIMTYTSAKETETSTSTTEIKFTITEPYGFSFLSNLNRASEALKQKSPRLGNIKNASRQFFILGVRFYGFDEEGKPINASDKKIPEKYYDITITGIDFTLQNKMSQYNVTATSMSPGTAFGMKRGIWKTGGNLTGTTVGEMIADLCSQMNKEAKDLVKDRPEAKYNKYTFSYVGAGAEAGEKNKTSGPIFSSLMRNKTQAGKDRVPTSGAENTEEAAKPSETKPNPVKVTLSFAAGTPILQVFETIIASSTYIEDAFKVIKTGVLDPQTEGKEKQNLSQESKAKIRWYQCSAQCGKADFDNTTQDWSFEFNYVFNVYETPMVDNPYSNLGIAYYGPHKQYTYIFGGKNTEIINYSQKLNNAYYVSLVNAAKQDNNSATASTPAAVVEGEQANAARTGSVANQNQQTLGFVSSLYDPSSMAVADVTILGDPDFLVDDTTSAVNKVYNEYYGVNGFTVNAKGGQVFIEIDWREAQDYGYETTDGTTYNATNKGLMSINDKVEFWRYQGDLASKIHNVSYMVGSVKSTFNQGKFNQLLKCYINTFPGYKPQEQRSESPSTPSQVQVASNNDKAAKPSLPPPVVTGDKTVDNLINLSSGDAGQQKTKPSLSGLVVDDDALAKASIGNTNQLLEGRSTPDVYSAQGRF